MQTALALAQFNDFLLGAGRLLWVFVYIECIRVGFRDRRCAMPFWALAFNISWEAIYATKILLQAGVTPHSAAIAAWLVLDLVILYTYLNFERPRVHRTAERNAGHFSSLVPPFASLISCLVVMLAAASLFRTYEHATAIALLINLLMSVLFIELLKQRGNSCGQSFTIAIGKFLATLAYTLHFATRPHTPPELTILCLVVAVYDSTYIVLLARQLREDAAKW